GWNPRSRRWHRRDRGRTLSRAILRCRRRRQQTRNTDRIMTVVTNPDFSRPAPRDNAAQRNSPTYRLAAFDMDFMLSDSMRGVRFLLEYAKPEEALRAWGVRSTIVVFGSARIRCDENGYDVGRRAPNGRRTRWYEEARRFGRIASERGG